MSVAASYFDILYRAFFESRFIRVGRLNTWIFFAAFLISMSVTPNTFAASEWHLRAFLNASVGEGEKFQIWSANLRIHSTGELTEKSGLSKNTKNRLTCEVRIFDSHGDDTKNASAKSVVIPSQESCNRLVNLVDRIEREEKNAQKTANPAFDPGEIKYELTHRDRALSIKFTAPAICDVSSAGKLVRCQKTQLHPAQELLIELRGIAGEELNLREQF